jgi:hypothetical protein
MTPIADALSGADQPKNKDKKDKKRKRDEGA